ncbi:hypothetical protein LEP1GSC195_1053 [Leptospira wolbachii serovar Codice str. CDC]|uniref:Uncharacterized protein n=1 Tax=Leptospira wolbachii serovar Codice str. CDC TaxID=1218599 RepID=R9ACU2_9LEPT|nr:hypothetical protein LEP1GSC195_1053 [Leptospira wolbachii serovar Codice str. CDC]
MGGSTDANCGNGKFLDVEVLSKKETTIWEQTRLDFLGKGP